MTPTTTSVRLRLALRVSVPLFLLNSVPFSSPFLCLFPISSSHLSLFAFFLCHSLPESYLSVSKSHNTLNVSYLSSGQDSLPSPHPGNSRRDDYVGRAPHIHCLPEPRALSLPRPSWLMSGLGLLEKWG